MYKSQSEKRKKEKQKKINNDGKKNFQKNG